MPTAPTVRQRIDELLDGLSAEEQQRVLYFILCLQGAPEGIPGKDLVEFFRQAPPEAVEAAREAYALYRQEHSLDGAEAAVSHEDIECAG